MPVEDRENARLGTRRRSPTLPGSTPIGDRASLASAGCQESAALKRGGSIGAATGTGRARRGHGRGSGAETASSRATEPAARRRHARRRRRYLQQPPRRPAANQRLGAFFGVGRMRTSQCRLRLPNLLQNLLGNRPSPRRSFRLLRPGGRQREEAGRLAGGLSLSSQRRAAAASESSSPAIVGCSPPVPARRELIALGEASVDRYELASPPCAGSFR